MATTVATWPRRYQVEDKPQAIVFEQLFSCHLNKCLCRAAKVLVSTINDL
jgi:hypothetical protein